MRSIIASTLVLLASVTLVDQAAAQPFSIDWHSLDAGATFETPAGLMTLSGAAAQLDAGSPAAPLTGGGFSLVGGFWAIVAPRCAADFNADGVVNTQDFFDFTASFFADDRDADFNRDSLVNSQDFFDFVGAFFSGCT